MRIIEKDAAIIAPAWNWHGRRTVRMHGEHDCRTGETIEKPSVRIEYNWWTVTRLPDGSWMVDGTDNAR
jgi:hypothetical protein